MIDPLDQLDLFAFELLPAAACPPIVPAFVRREWMDRTSAKFANKCLPLLIANQAGWFVLNTQTVRVIWTGGNAVASVGIEYADGEPANPHIVSAFGHGIVTWKIPFLFRTPPEFNLLARGPANWPKRGVYPLEGIVETDWSPATFTMNWKILELGNAITFESGEPICMLVPQRKSDLERFAPRRLPVAQSPELDFATYQWSRHRLKVLQEPQEAKGMQLEYFRGRIGDASAPYHKTRIAVHEFERVEESHGSAGGCDNDP